MPAIARRTRSSTGVALTAVAVVASCSSARQAPEATGTPSSTAPSASVTCPAASSGAAWPAVVPQKLPVLPGLAVVDSARQGTSQAVRFTAVSTIRDAAAFLAGHLPAAGFRLRGGDSEQDEIDQPFTGYGRTGTFKIHSTDECHLHGVLVVSLP